MKHRVGAVGAYEKARWLGPIRRARTRVDVRGRRRQLKQPGVETISAQDQAVVVREISVDRHVAGNESQAPGPAAPWEGQRSLAVPPPRVVKDLRHTA